MKAPTFARDVVPASKMPASCALFCRAGQSCDPCHPDNDGYALLATKVFQWIVAAKGTDSGSEAHA